MDATITSCRKCSDSKQSWTPIRAPYVQSIRREKAKMSLLYNRGKKTTLIFIEIHNVTRYYMSVHSLFWKVNVEDKTQFESVKKNSIK